MSWVAVGVGAVTAVGGAIKASKASKDKKKAAAEIASQKGNDLQNVAEGMTVSTKGADIQKEAMARNSAGAIDALSGAGSRSIGVGVGRVASATTAASQQIAADLDEQQKDIDRMAAGDRGNIRGIKENRANDKLAALSSQYNAAADSEQQGYGNIVQGAGMAAGQLSTSDYFSKENVAARKAKRDANKKA